MNDLVSKAVSTIVETQHYGCYYLFNLSLDSLPTPMGTVIRALHGKPKNVIHKMGFHLMCLSFILSNV